MFDLSAYIEGRRAWVDAWLDERLPGAGTRPTVLHQAIRYCVLSGGKRLRPIVCLAACEAVCGAPDAARAPALAVELLHTYTLIHDDLPSMDDDSVRRGRPTAHVVYGEANAILAGDALQALAFEVCAETPAPPPYPPLALVRELARAAGSQGVIAGQVEDLAPRTAPPDADAIGYIHMRKTADLFRACARMGAIAAAADAPALDALDRYGSALGLAFQVTDDLLDAVPGAGAAPPELSCLSVYSREEAVRLAQEHTQSALRALSVLPRDRAEPLAAVARKLLTRTA